MAKASQSVESTIKSTFPLQVAVRCTEEVELMCCKNRLRFCEILKPFCALSNNVQLKDVQGHLYNLRNVRVRFSEPPAEVVPESKLRILLGEAVQSVALRPDGGRTGGSVHIGNVSATASTPWFDAYKDTYLDFLKQSDHETIKHYVSVILVVSSTCKDPLEEFSQLYAKQKQSEQSKYPKWLLPHIYYYHVLLHDVMDGAAHLKSSQDNFSKVKAKYGENSYMFQINSCPPSPTTQLKPGPDVWTHHFRPANGRGGEDETDGVFKKLHFRRKGKNKTLTTTSSTSSSSSSSSSTSNNAVETSPNLSTVGVAKPDRLREEPQLIHCEPTSPENSLSCSVEPGADPLSQLAARTSVPTGEVLGEGTPNSSFNHALQNDESSSVRPGRGEVGHYGQCLTESDHRNIRNFVIDFVIKKLLPHLNEVLRNLNEWLVSRRSVRRSFSNMFKGFKMFGGPNNVSDEANYPSTSLEMQLRQLADIAFLLQSYELAFQSYHQVKKDFQSSNAWMYYGGAVEMCAMSAYLLSSTRRDVVSYMEEAISIYNTSCKAPHYAIRTSLVLLDVFKERGSYKELTQLCIRMTAEDADLRSAMCLEQAAHGFLRSQPSLARKYALHLVLAGNRYARAAQRLHSLRTYQIALELYQGKQWTLAEDYVLFCLAKHSFNLHHLMDAKEAFEKLLSHESTQSPSLQRLHLQDYIYVYKQLLLLENSTAIQIPLTTPTTSQSHARTVRDVPVLPLPFVSSQRTRVTLTTGPSPHSLTRPLEVEQDLLTKPRSRSTRDAHHQLQIAPPPRGCGLDELRADELTMKSRSASTSNTTTIGQYLLGLSENRSHDNTKRVHVIGGHDYEPVEGVRADEWEELERRAAVGMQGTLHENFSPSVQVLDHETGNSQMPFIVVNESIGVGVVLRNPLKGVPLLLTNLCLVWDATPTATPSPNSPIIPDAAVCDVLKQVLLQPEEEKMVTLHITPLKEGELMVTGFVFNLCIESNSSAKSNSPLNPGGLKANSLTLTLNSRDSLYQVHQGASYQGLLSEGVQGRVEFEVRGHRLNDSKTEKSSVVYSKDHRLHWRVTAPMPKIAVTMSAVPNSLLAGEMTRVSVEVINVGQVSLNSLRLSSSLGPQLLLDKLSSELHHSIYPSTLLSPLDHTPSHALSATPLPTGTFSPRCLELPLPQGRLEPGKRVRAHLILQGPKLTSVSDWEIPWNMVFYYEPALISANSRLSHLVLRHSCMLHVRESLQLRASAVHGLLPTSASSSSSSSSSSSTAVSSTSKETGRFDLNKLIVTLEAENKCQLSHASTAVEIRVSQLSCVSAKWCLEKLDREQNLLCLLPSESGVIHLKGSRLEHQTGMGYSDVPLGPTLIPSQSFPVNEVFSGSATYSSLGVAGAEEEGSRKKRSKDREEIALIVFWQALVPTGSESVFSYGHHTITVPLPQSMSALRESSRPPSPYDLVKFYLEHPTSYRHEGFVKADSRVSSNSEVIVQPGLCQVPVSIILQNCHQSTVKVMVELVQPKEDSSKKQSEPSFFWSGGCKRQVKMEGRCTQTLPVYANFSSPAVYNLNTIQVKASLGGGGAGGSGFHLQRWHRTSHMTVV